MIEKRAFHRVPFAIKVILADNYNTLSGQLANISFGGALVRLGHYPSPSMDSKYLLTVYTDEDALPLQMIAEVAYISDSTVGLRFTSIDQDSRERLGALMCSIERILYSESERVGIDCV